MKIVSIVPGFGGTFYCGNCLRDSAFAASLRQSGHETVILPMYLPLTITGQMSQPDTPVFYGAVNIFLKQRFPLFRNTPAWLERLLNSGPILRFAAKKSGSTRASGLEGLTESMLLGKTGNQSHELTELVEFLLNHEKPDIVHFSNALLIGLAEEIRTKLNIPVVCSLQDEDVWVDAMHAEHRTKIWKLMAEKSQHVDAFISVSQYFASRMKMEMNIPDDKIHIIPIGINPDLYTPSEPTSDPYSIGYVSRICEENGFEVLVDAFILLRSDKRFSNVRLKATGGYTGDDRKFIRKQQKKLKQNHLLDDFELIHDFSFPSLQKFFKQITLLSVPVLKGEAFGLYQLEALASGKPLVQPELGAFPEIIANTAGGITYHPNSPESLAQAWKDVLLDKNLLISMSKSGRQSVIEKYHANVLTKRIINLYSDLIRKSLRK
jgi:glycosyltransferase involved in cell wall biosynthesis